MFQYFFSFDRKNQHVNVEIHFEYFTKSSLRLQLPAWRPGRYQLQNFSKNILNFNARSNNVPLNWHKDTKNTWIIETNHTDAFIISYSYYAAELNAGSSLVNYDMIYVNPINLTMYPDYAVNSSVKISLLNTNPLIFAGGIEHTIHENSIDLNAKNFHELFDSPFILSQKIEHFEFKASSIPFHFWIQGIHFLDIEKLKIDLKKVAEYQINLFGEFPEKEYHFLLIIPYQNYYHGVEHRNSTVMVLGAEGILTAASYQDLLGLASHELFHTWNIAKIRPLELLPYDYTQENYFRTCFVAEGYTTYYGDKTLLDAGVFSETEYVYELENTLKRHFQDADYASQSLLESSFDLWVDGYDKGTPNKKVSVYHKGAIATLILDALIRKKFGNNKSMDTVMRKLYEQFGDLKKGYTYSDIKALCEEVYEGPLDTYFENIIEGNQPILNSTKEALEYFSIEMQPTNENFRLSLKKE